jgi:hypothetical protein
MEAREMQDSDQAAVWGQKICSRHLNNITGEVYERAGTGSCKHDEKQFDKPSAPVMIRHHRVPTIHARFLTHDSG